MHLVINIPDDKEPEGLWTSIYAGADEFTRAEQRSLRLQSVHDSGAFTHRQIAAGGRAGALNDMRVNRGQIQENSLVGSSAAPTLAIYLRPYRCIIRPGT